MEWKVGDGVRVDQRLGTVHRVLTNEIAVLFDGDACKYFYPKDARYLTKVVLSDDLGAVVYISTAKPEPLPTLSLGPVSATTTDSRTKDARVNAVVRLLLEARG